MPAPASGKLSKCILIWESYRTENKYDPYMTKDTFTKYITDYI